MIVILKIILAPAKRVMSLQNPLSKMSKSDPNPLSKILITDTPTEIHQKVMAAISDSTNSISYDPVHRRAVSNLVELLSHFDKDGRSPEQLGKLHEGMSIGSFKKMLGETIGEELEPVRKRYEVFINEDGGKYIDYMATKGMRRAIASANETMEIVKKAIGLWA